MNIAHSSGPPTKAILRKMNEDEEDLIPGPVPAPPPTECFGTRHMLAFLAFLGFANVYAMRVNLSVAIVAMVNNTAIPHVNTSTADVCPVPNVTNSTHQEDGEFVWNEYEQGLILGSFFYGYVVTNLIGGRLGELIGGKVVFGVGVLVTSVLTLLTPIVARYSTTLFIILRVIEGLGEGVTFPAMNSMMARWIPPLERSKMSARVYAGSQFGTVVSLPICGLLCQSTFLGGWPSVFYVFGVLGLLWFVVWMFVVHNTPDTHPRISEAERIYITSSLGPSKVLPIPIKHILMSMPFWAIFVVHIAQNWGFYTLLTELPTYMKNILHFNIADNSFMSALPYLVMWLFSILVGQVADHLRSKGTLSTTTTRRICNSIGHYGPMVCLIAVGYVGCKKDLAILFLCGAVGFNGATYAGYMNSHLDIAPNFAGTLMGFTNCFATIPGFLAPQIVGLIINGQETVSRWRLVFWIASIVYFVGNTFYLIFVSGEKQYWNNLEELEPCCGTAPSPYGAISVRPPQQHSFSLPPVTGVVVVGGASGTSSSSTTTTHHQQQPPPPYTIQEIF